MTTNHSPSKLPPKPRRPRVTRKVVAVCIGAAATLGILATTASAHPLGNFTVNTAAEVIVRQSNVEINYAIDMAEVPTLQSSADADDNGDISKDEANTFAASKCDEAATGVGVEAAGENLSLEVRSASGAVVPGSADLATLRIDCVFRSSEMTATSDAGELSVNVDDRFAASHIGWHEVVVVGDQMTIESSDVPAVSPSEHLTAYPADGVLAAVTNASVVATSGGPSYVGTTTRSPTVNSIIPGVDTLAIRLMGDGTGNPSLGSAFLLLLTATLLGAMHAFAPGHGKTVMAAYLLGDGGGSVRQALVLGATVTATHTIGVLALGAMITLSTLTAPDRIYPFLGILSGLLVAGIGANLLRMAVRSRRNGGRLEFGHHHGDLGHSHQHGGHGHSHGGHSHDDHAHSHGAHAHNNHSHSHDSHSHGHDAPAHSNHSHSHDNHSHGHSHDEQGTTKVRTTAPTLEQPAPMRLGSVIAMGFAGGLVPSPSALIVLLGAVALGRTLFGIGMVAAYGFGMALTLVSAGLIFVLLRDRATRLLTGDPGRRIRNTMRFAPLVTAVAVVGGGMLIAARAAAQL